MVCRSWAEEPAVTRNQLILIWGLSTERNPSRLPPLLEFILSPSQQELQQLNLSLSFPYLCVAYMTGNLGGKPIRKGPWEKISSNMVVILFMALDVIEDIDFVEIWSLLWTKRGKFLSLQKNPDPRGPKTYGSYGSSRSGSGSGTLPRSVVDPWHFGTDPDTRIRTSDNGSGFGSSYGSSFFRQWPSRWQLKMSKLDLHSFFR
jgi:hypothetical protein